MSIFRGSIVRVACAALLILVGDVIGCSHPTAAWTRVDFKDGFQARLFNGQYIDLGIGVGECGNPITIGYVQSPKGDVYRLADLTPDDIRPYAKRLGIDEWQKDGKHEVSYGTYPTEFKFCNGRLVFLSLSEKYNDGWKLSLSERGPWITFPCSVDSLHSAFGEPINSHDVSLSAP